MQRPCAAALMGEATKPTHDMIFLCCCVGMHASSSEQLQQHVRVIHLVWAGCKYIGAVAMRDRAIEHNHCLMMCDTSAAPQELLKMCNL